VRGNRGFTLIELMIAVAIMGILTALVVFVFLGSSRKVHSVSEVTAVFSEFHRAEAQYAVEHGSFYSTGTDSGDIFPTTPTEHTQALGTVPAAWTTLHISMPSQDVYCGYVAVAGTATDDYPDFAADFNTIDPVGNWYALYAECNADGNSSVNGQFFSYSGDTTLQRLHETN
jgi:prepilin-type N-terminal cleavage/methylation domain-containing protein